MTGDEALEMLIDGNKRFVDGKSQHPHENVEWRKTLMDGQHPFAVVVSCSDSRVPVEILFDQGFGDLFVIRVAGNIVSRNELGSILYAVEHTDVSLIYILGHENCGAITAAFASAEEREKESGEVQNLLSIIDPGIKDIDHTLNLNDKVHLGVEANVGYMKKLLEQNTTIAECLEKNKIKIAAGIYELDTGVVRLLK